MNERIQVTDFLTPVKNWPVVILTRGGEKLAEIPAAEALELAHEIQLAAAAALSDRALVAVLNPGLDPALNRERVGKIMDTLRERRHRFHVLRGASH